MVIKQRVINSITYLIFFSFLITAILSNMPLASARNLCNEWIAKIVSVEGVVQVKKGNRSQWMPVNMNETLVYGDTIQVKKPGRAEVLLCNGNTLRLDQNTTITITDAEEGKTFFMELLNGAFHFFSHFPGSIKLYTPFVNASVKGTEFLVKVEKDHALVSVFEGEVDASNNSGSIILGPGQSAIAREGQSPAAIVLLNPRDTVQWALYYPPVIFWRPDDFQEGEKNDWQSMVRKSIEFYWKNDSMNAFSSLEGVPGNINNPDFFLYRASLYLSVGRVDEAQGDIQNALKINPHDPRVFSLQSIIALIKNQKESALELAHKAVESEPRSAAARIALSYAQQASFDLSEAMKTLQEAVKSEPENAIAWSRLAELWLSFGELEKGLNAAQEALRLNQNLSHVHSVLGFTYLMQLDIEKAVATFKNAINMDQADPLPRLGLGLALIRQDKLEEGRGEMEIAASLSPNYSLIRSYLGKAYYEEKRHYLATDQFNVARELDPLDPTPWFYEAIQKQTQNRPVESLHDLQKSIKLNDNRAVYRSRLLLDEDYAARCTTTARIYDELGFQQLALAEGWKAINTDPANYSAHRFLADSYYVLPRHEIARVSELLQSQLLQPINITPLHPQLGESKLFIFEGAGPSKLSFNEFTSLFFRNRITVQANGIAGGNDTLGDELGVAGTDGRFSYSFGQFHYETDGFRSNNDLEKDIYNLFSQIRLSPTTNLQAEFRYTETDNGDLELRFDPDNFDDTMREKQDTDSIRVGFHHSFSYSSDLLASYMFKKKDYNIKSDRDQYELQTEEDGSMSEVQHIFRLKWIRFIGGIGYFELSRKDTDIVLPLEPTVTPSHTRHTNFYVYPQIDFTKNCILTIGLSTDFLKGAMMSKDAIINREQANPKLGLTWTPIPSTTLRMAAFRTLKRHLITDQTLEPTQIMGFNQFFDDGTATVSWNYGIGLDQKFSQDIFGGIEYYKRDMDVPFVRYDIYYPDPNNPDPTTCISNTSINKTDWEEKFIRAYLYFTPHPYLSLTTEFQYERFQKKPQSGLCVDLKTYKIPVGIQFFHPSGFITKLKATNIYQEGVFLDYFGEETEDNDYFWIFDASIGLRLPKRIGVITLEGRNIFDTKFNFQDTDPANPGIYPERIFFARFTLMF